MAEQEAASPTDIAIIGMSGRFPGARNIIEFWRNLRDGVEAISFFSDEELTAAGVEPSALTSPDYVRAGGVLEDVELFDAAFFGFNPKEAETLDPQQRLFLESAWEALEDAGYDPEAYEGLIGVYAGSSGSSYLTNLYSHPELVNALGEFQIGLGNDKDNLTTSASYKLNLKGPSMAIQAACSTSLVAVGVACQNLLSYQCDMALAGGVRVVVPQAAGYFYQEGGIMSPDGHCRAFDAEARGTVGGNGVGLVLMKRLEEALADGDHVYAVIKGAAINNDGALKVGYTAPSIEGQAQVIGLAQAVAGVEAETITYVETHGTGTDLGDPIEVAALTQAFRAGTDKNNFCGIGSVKTNIGHLDTAAGVAGLIKTVLALKHRMIPPSLNFERPNPKIDFAESPFYVNSHLKEWETNGAPRRAGVSSFGIGGTNAHVVLEEAPLIAAGEEGETEQLLVLSARSRNALDAATSNLVEHLKQNPDLNLADVAYTLQVGRRAFNYRRAIVCRSVEDAINGLEAADNRRVLTGERPIAGRPVVFMFPGQGSQHAGMARELYRAEPVFREQIDLCSELLRPQLGLDLREVMFAEEESAAVDAELQVQQTALAQPALFIIEYALSKLWIDRGIRPQAMIGHSIGEYVAAALAGVFSLEDALSLVAARGRLMQRMPKGAMLAVPLAEQKVDSLLGTELSLAAVNVPSMSVVSGPVEAVARLETQLSADGHAFHRLQTSHAFHSQMMDGMLEEFAAEVEKVNLNPPQMPYVSNRTGEWIRSEDATSPVYWVEHLRRTVRFGEGLERFFKHPDWLLLEVGPGQTLSGLARQHPGKPTEQVVLSSLPHRNDQQSDARFMLNTLGRLWLAGAQVNWRQLHANQERRRVSLPTYPFERQRFWVEYQPEASGAAPAQPARGKKPDVADWFYLPSWKRSVPAGLLREKELASTELCWLMFVDECGVGAQVASRLAQAGGQTIVTVKAGQQFTKYGEHEYTVAPGESDHYRALFDELRQLGKLPDRILHFWSVTPDDDKQSPVEGFDQAQDSGFYSLVFLAQALSAQEKVADRLRIEVVSNHTQNVMGDESTRAAKATVLAPCIVIPQEYPHITCRNIDVVTRSSGNGTGARLIEQLLAEFMAENSDTVVAYRGGHRWVQTFEEVRLEKDADGSSPLRENGVYLITGGLGGVGLVLARHLARSVRARLVLVGRTALPDRQDWVEWLSSHTDDDEVGQKIRGVRELEDEGAEVLTLSADVSDLTQMKEVVQSTLERFGALHGVIHAAGLTANNAFQPIQESTRQICERHFQPKAHGLMVLDEALSDIPVDFCLLLSSLSSILGGLGFVAYAAANIFMDAYAEGRVARGPARWTSVNWDGWQLWEGDQTSSELAELAILPEEGADAFERILSRDRVSQIVVSTGNLQARINRWVKLESLREMEDSGAVELSAAHARPELGNTFVAPRNEAERAIADTWQKLLGIAQVGVYDNFFELGGHSLLALQIVARLRDAFQVEVPVRDLFDAPTIAELAERVEQTRHVAEREVEQIDEALRLVEQLSEDEIEALLAGQESAGEDTV
jgi:acyl transferase domain-containing protein